MDPQQSMTEKYITVWEQFCTHAHALPRTHTSHLRLLEKRALLVVKMVHLLEAPFGVLQKQLEREEVRDGHDDSD